MFDEREKEALEYLFENFWIINEKDPDRYFQIITLENKLRPFLLEKFGFHLIINKHFIKLDKSPVAPEPWMGIQEFKSPKDYAFMCCLMAYISKKNVDEQFLLQDACEHIRVLYPGEGTMVDWENYGHRLSLVRVIKYLDSIGVLRINYGDPSGFHNQADFDDVLFQVTVLARYFLRPFLKDFEEYDDLINFISYETSLLGELSNEQVAYRRLLLSPVTHRSEVSDDEWAYYKRNHEILEQGISDHFDYRCEIYKNELFLTTDEMKITRNLNRNTRVVSDISFELAGKLKEMIERGELNFDEFTGILEIMENDLERAVESLKEKQGQFWSKEYREKTVNKITAELIEYLTEWKLASRMNSNMVAVYPAFARTVGKLSEEMKETCHE